MHDYHQMLKHNDLKATPQRLAILQKMDEYGHVGIDELYGELRESYPSLSLATIYKNIQHLQEAQLIKEVKIPDQKQKYEIRTTPHTHLICTHCGNIYDIECDVGMLSVAIEQQSGFQVEEPFIAFNGVCKKCQA